ncbi:hypothetical protein V2J09_009336, partial [Rumex salicifolius]
WIRYQPTFAKTHGIRERNFPNEREKREQKNRKEACFWRKIITISDSSSASRSKAVHSCIAQHSTAPTTYFFNTASSPSLSDILSVALVCCRCTSTFNFISLAIASNQKNLSLKRLADAEHKSTGSAMLNTVQEISIYIHRFHNLDLFQQGWYQIKVTMRWEDNDYASVGTPSRVVQYEGPNLDFEGTYGVWRIDDSDNSFSTQPFKIKYARQDILLSVMIAFNLSMGKHVAPSRSAVILKFELMYAPFLQKGSELLGFVAASATATHEFRIPPKALLGLHSYCPVYFDAFHAVLLDLSVHITLLKSSVYKNISKESRNEDGATSDGSNSGSSKTASVNSEDAVLVKGLLTARDILIEEIERISKAINQSIDLTARDTKLFDSPLVTHLSSSNSESSMRDSIESQDDVENTGPSVGFQSTPLHSSLSGDMLGYSAHLVGDQINHLWNMFLNFHRANKIKILEYLRWAWASDRRVEWSIWMVHSKMDIPHHYIRSRVDDQSSHGRQGEVSVLRRLTDDPAQTATTRAELHRRSVSQMRINSRSIQDMQIFADPSHVPIVIVEHVINTPNRSRTGDSHLHIYDQNVSTTLLSELKAVGKFSAADHQSRSCILRVVVFVHGFQGHHLDLRLVRNQWLLIDPKAECLMSEVNEDKTSGDLREMGLRLAQEVISFLKKKMDKASRSGSLKSIKLSFVGHSIGNVIIRTALTESIMEPYLRFLHTYVSVSGPHLGYLYSSNSLFNSGLWLLKKLKNTQCIHQLTLTDDPDLHDTFFYKLCQHNTLDNFRNIILLSSPQDGYVPYHSARIENCQAASSDSSKRGKVFQEMLNTCLDQIHSSSAENKVFMRCDVNFNMSSHGRNLNTLIGRAAHIEFLETDIFARFVMWSFPEYFV